MIKSLTVTNHLGETISIVLRSPEQSGFFIKGIDGLGPGKSTLNFTESLSVDGGIFNSARVSYRNIVLRMGFYDTIESVEFLRRQSYRFFPLKRLIELEIETDDRIGNISGYVESNEPDIFSKQETTIISILCPSAFFRDSNIIETAFSGIIPTFEFPFENPSLTESLIEFGQVYIDTQKSVFYNGDVSTGAIIKIHFLANHTQNISIVNTTTGDTMTINAVRVLEILGTTFLAGDDIYISSIKGSKYVTLRRNNVDHNIINAIGLHSDWFTLDRGDNVFTYTTASGIGNLQFSIFHQNLYEGL